MSAAQELAERGFSVTVLEGRDQPGGKARSFPVPHSSAPGRDSLPAEHGFRFFPGFYRHLPDTMRRIPYRNQADGVLGNLRDATESEIARSGGLPPVKLPAHFPDSVRDLQLILHTVLHPIAQLSPGDYAYFASRLLVLLTSCEERRYDEWDRVSWWDFSGASHRSVAYQKFMADGLTRTLVAARAREMSARTGGYTLLQLLFDLGTPGREADRVLNGPTSDVWISPWLAHLEHLGVNFELGVRVEELETQAGRISGVIVADSRGRRRVAADWYVAAVPVEHMNASGERRHPRGRSRARPVVSPRNPLDERHRILPSPRTHPSSTDTSSTSTRRGPSPRSRRPNSGATSRLPTSDREMCVASSPSTSRSGRRRVLSRARRPWTVREKKSPPTSSLNSGRTSRRLIRRP